MRGASISTGRSSIGRGAATARPPPARQQQQRLAGDIVLLLDDQIDLVTIVGSAGTEEEKMAPWMGAFIDNLESLGTGVEKDSQASVDFIMKRVQLRSLSFMRGRTFNDTLLIIDEAQNLTPKQIKSLITRAGRNTKIVCLGNVAQIDTPYLTPTTCGLTYLVQRFQDWPHAGHITLSRIQRSRLALRAEEVL